MEYLLPGAGDGARRRGARPGARGDPRAGAGCLRVPGHHLLRRRRPRTIGRARSWVEFYAERRLLPLARAARDGGPDRAGGASRPRSPDRAPADAPRARGRGPRSSTAICGRATCSPRRAARPSSIRPAPRATARWSSGSRRSSAASPSASSRLSRGAAAAARVARAQPALSALPPAQPPPDLRRPLRQRGALDRAPLRLSRKRRLNCVRTELRGSEPGSCLLQHAEAVVGVAKARRQAAASGRRRPAHVVPPRAAPARAARCGSGSCQSRHHSWTIVPMSRRPYPFGRAAADAPGPGERALGHLARGHRVAPRRSPRPTRPPRAARSHSASVGSRQRPPVSSESHAA